MAVSKLWAVNSRLGQVIDYAANPEKTAVDIYSEEQYLARLDELNILLNMDKKENEIVGGEPDEGESTEKRKEKSYER